MVEEPHLVAHLDVAVGQVVPGLKVVRLQRPVLPVGGGRHLPVGDLHGREAQPDQHVQLAAAPLQRLLEIADTLVVPAAGKYGLGYCHLIEKMSYSFL